MVRRSISLMWARRLSVAGLVTATLAPSAALAEVRHEGDWSDDDPEVSLDLDNVPRAEAVNRLAAAAGWSVVINAPKGDPVSVHVKDQPASKLLDLLLTDGRYVARRDDKLIAIAADDWSSTAPLPPFPAVAPPPVPAAVPALPPLPPLPSIDADDGHDRLVTGGNLRVDAGEVVHDITVMGGNLDVFGTVTGDLSVMGGNVHLHQGAHVKGDAASIGGTLTMDSGAVVDGDVGVVGGEMRREEGARIGGEVHEGMGRGGRHRRTPGARAGRDTPGHAAAAAVAKSADSDPPKVKRLASEAAGALNAAALLFVFGAVLLALAPERMERLKVQIASHPMRSFATGVVAFLGGILVLAAMCLTVIGIPFAVVGLLGAVFATVGGVCSVLETVGGALLAHRTKNPYVHLACGGLIFLVVGAIPFLGGLIKIAVVLTAFGSVVATRAAGLLPVRGRAATPYRQADVM